MAVKEVPPPIETSLTELFYRDKPGPWVVPSATAWPFIDSSQAFLREASPTPIVSKAVTFGVGDASHKQQQLAQNEKVKDSECPGRSVFKRPSVRYDGYR